jgi:hypothetical protein
MKRLPIITIIVLLLTPWMFAQDKALKAGQTAAESWLALVDKGDYAGSYDQAASLFKSAVTKADWQQKIKAARDPLGKMLSRKVKFVEYTTSLPGAPDGQYVVIQYDTSFENKKSAVETVTPMLDKDGQWRVSGYFVR